MNRSDLLAQARQDLPLVHDRLLWAHADGYTPEAPNPDRPAPKPTSGPPPTNPDHVKGPRHDIGIGNHQARVAHRAAVGHLAHAERQLVIAVFRDGHDHQPLAICPTVATTPADLTRCIDHMAARLDMLDHPDGAPAADRHLDRAATSIDKAYRVLTKLDAGTTSGHATAEPLCRVCLIRPRAARKGGRCSTCKTWHDRNGFERPRHLDGDVIGDAMAAQARRRARGEGHGDESFSAATGRRRDLEDQIRQQRESR